MTRKDRKRVGSIKIGTASGNEDSTLRRRSAGLAAVSDFDEVLALIEVARQRAYQAVNTELVGLYWQLGEYISRKLESAQWGDAVVDELAAAIARQCPGMRGYTRSNLFRMRQFFETYRTREKVAPLVRQLPWTHHLLILGRTRHDEEREFYILAAIQGRWTKRELERQIRSGAALRAGPGRKTMSPALARIHPSGSSSVPATRDPATGTGGAGSWSHIDPDLRCLRLEGIHHVRSRAG